VTATDFVRLKIVVKIGASYRFLARRRNATALEIGSWHRFPSESPSSTRLRLHLERHPLESVTATDFPIFDFSIRGR
jgi:hypothetical protein